ncbi:MAG: hypothetical protein IJS90_00350 [Clostridia bacterium]|nr:hypothetical protein [Clostridia bacterium]
MEEITAQTKVTELSKIFNQILNFLREFIHVLEQVMAGIKVKYAWEEEYGETTTAAE